jgi:hypothetical protein
LFESFISDSSRGIMPMKGFEDAPEGTWFGSMHVENDKVWEFAKQGLLKGFSIEGLFSMKKSADTIHDYKSMSDEQKIEFIKQLLSQLSEA